MNNEQPKEGNTGVEKDLPLTDRDRNSLSTFKDLCPVCQNPIYTSEHKCQNWKDEAIFFADTMERLYHLNFDLALQQKIENAALTSHLRIEIEANETVRREHAKAIAALKELIEITKLYYNITKCSAVSTKLESAIERAKKLT